MLIALLILITIIFSPLLFTLIMATSEIIYFRMCLRQKVWVSPIRLFLYRLRKIDLRKVVHPLLYLHEEGFPIDIKKIERLYLEGKDIQKVSLIMLWLNNLKTGENIEQIFERAYKLESCYKYEEDDIFIFNEKFSKMYLVNILSKKIEDKNLRMYIEFSSDSDFESVMEKTLQGFALQGSLKPDISKLLRQYDTKQELTDEIANNKEEVVTYINQNIDKEKYAFDINNLSLGLVKMNDVADLLNEHYRKETNNTDSPFIATEIDSEDITTYLYLKNDQKMEEVE